ncbi:MAG: substrate-binding domain-containing protein [Alphaproteobacteria bacterium]
MMKKILKTALVLTMLSMGSQALAAKKIGLVVKVGGIPWFNAMEVGLKEKAKELGYDTVYIGPTSADPALQVRAIEDLIAQKVDVIGVVPNDAEVLEPVLKRAMEAGIKVISHESPAQENVNWNFEMTTAQSFGEAYMRSLCEALDGKGGYAIFVGGLTVPLHNAWADAAIAYQEKNCPDMKKVADRFGVAENVDDSRRTALDLMKSHEDLRGILAFGSQGPIGAARAVDERDAKGKVIVMGPFSAGQGKRLVEKDVLYGGYIWNPLEAGKVFVTISDMLLKGEEFSDGMNIDGLDEVKIDAENKDIYANKLVPLNKDTIDELADLGL